jgi:hypothetical protein
MQRHDLGMAQWRLQSFASIGAESEESLGAYQNRADRNFAKVCAFPRQVKGLAHPFLVLGSLVQK